MAARALAPWASSTTRVTSPQNVDESNLEHGNVAKINAILTVLYEERLRVTVHGQARWLNCDSGCATATLGTAVAGADNNRG